MGTQFNIYTILTFIFSAPSSLLICFLRQNILFFSFSVFFINTTLIDVFSLHKENTAIVGVSCCEGPVYSAFDFHTCPFSGVKFVSAAVNIGVTFG
jgi:hypothetical protein